MFESIRKRLEAAKYEDNQIIEIRAANTLQKFHKKARKDIETLLEAVDVLTETLRGIKECTGTSTEAWHIANKALARVEEMGK